MMMFILLVGFFQQSVPSEANIYSKKVIYVNNVAFIEEIRIEDGKSITEVRPATAGDLPNVGIIPPGAGASQPAYSDAYIVPSFGSVGVGATANAPIGIPKNNQ